LDLIQIKPQNAIACVDASLNRNLVVPFAEPNGVPMTTILVIDDDLRIIDVVTDDLQDGPDMAVSYARTRAEAEHMLAQEHGTRAVIDLTLSGTSALNLVALAANGNTPRLRPQNDLYRD
jgi:hypothetical protein